MAGVRVSTVPSFSSQSLGLFSQTFLLGFLRFNTLLLLLSLLASILAELYDLPIHGLDASCERFSIVFELFKAYL